MSNRTELGFSEREQLTEQLIKKLIKELREKYALENPLPDLDEAKTHEELKQYKVKYRTMIDWLSYTIDYEKYMLEYMELAQASSHDFWLVFEDVLIREVFPERKKWGYYGDWKLSIPFFNWQKKNKNLKTDFSLGVQITQMKLNILFYPFKLLVICKKEIT